ncbi:MAG: hypothetical protein OXD30_07850 [Bryobacterales bacterium]|nr:hypothetical protein [Bryobacterales bacterium]
MLDVASGWPRAGADPGAAAGWRPAIAGAVDAVRTLRSVDRAEEAGALTAVPRTAGDVPAGRTWRTPPARTAPPRVVELDAAGAIDERRWKLSTEARKYVRCSSNGNLAVPSRNLDTDARFQFLGAAARTLLDEAGSTRPWLARTGTTGSGPRIATPRADWDKRIPRGVLAPAAPNSAASK